MLETATVHPGWSESELENSSEFIKPFPLGFINHSPGLQDCTVHQGRAGSPIAWQFFRAVPCFQRFGTLQTPAKPEVMMENTVLTWKCWVAPNPNSMSQRAPWCRDSCGRAAWLVGKHGLDVWCALKTCKPPAAELTLGNCSAFCKGVGTNWMSTEWGYV